MSGQKPKDDSQVIIERLNNTYLLPQQHPNPDDLRSRLDAVVRNRIATVCGQLLSRALDGADPSVWLIRRLDADLVLDIATVSDELFSQILSQQIAARIVRTISRGADGNLVMHFPDRAAFLAHFLGDLAAGSAWDKWYYSTFASLRSLPTSAAVREALLREPALAETILRRLGEGLERVLEVLSENDALQVYEIFFVGGEHDAGLEREAIEALLAVWPVARIRADMEKRNALRLYLTARRHNPNLPANSLRLAITHLLGFAEILRRVEDSTLLLERLSRGNLRGAIELARRRGVTGHLECLPFLQQLAASDGDWLTRLAQTVNPAVRASKQAEAKNLAEAFGSSFGSIFLLLPSWFDLGMHEIIAAAPYADLEGLDKAQALRWLLALKCLGRTRAGEAVYDSALSFAAGFDARPSCDDLQRFSAAATAEMNQAALRLLIERLTWRGRIEGRCVCAELVTQTAGGEILLLRDMAHDDWFYATSINEEISAALNEGLAMLRETVGVPLECLLLQPGLETRLDIAALASWQAQLVWREPDPSRGLLPVRLNQTPEDEMTVWIEPAATMPEDRRAILLRYLARARPAASELDYFSLIELNPPIVTNTHFDLTWSLMARAVLKKFAHRLLGFGWSSAEHLYQNFLAGQSLVRIEKGRDEKDQIAVQLPHAPLHLILRMAGVDGQTCTIPWLNEARVTLSLPAE